MFGTVFSGTAFLSLLADADSGIEFSGTVLSSLLADPEASDLSKTGVANAVRAPAALSQAGLGLWGSKGLTETTVPLELAGIPGIDRRFEIARPSATAFFALAPGFASWSFKGSQQIFYPWFNSSAETYLCPPLVLLALISATITTTRCLHYKYR